MSGIFEWKGPITELVLRKIKSEAADLVTTYIEALPILIGVSIGVYALLSMINRSLANLGVIGVFVYGALVVVS